ncbi:hypothetical protein H7J87_08395 [Mycolicibacterium wolinskyi]|uniref:Uncharacterized protein n=1 Tax=Mycolicibacterium wolinskyi TaxID=59750 RepID=A0A1X2FIA4_9MYCO|nr:MULTISPECIES: hypothetical protein [Mycolicibacterium]MCV7285346.1 hypothetical protein [Mycolicibacterium wolinskyi]MCV7295151.1 hypothetical protein [Mycolicibacterium goodii]ORX17719.1 hypothetical protein AWC31_14845 [Mycolicibacterium wolinskyi]
MDLHTLRHKIADSTSGGWNKITCWGAGSGPVYHYGLSSENGDNGIETEAKGHANTAVLIEDVDISIAWGYDPDETQRIDHRQTFDYDFLPELADDDTPVTRIYADVFYRGALVDRMLFAVADGGRYYVPIPRTVYPNRVSVRERGEPEHHYTRWQLGFASLLNSFEHAEPIEDLLAEVDYVVDDD